MSGLKWDTFIRSCENDLTKKKDEQKINTGHFDHPEHTLNLTLYTWTVVNSDFSPKIVFVVGPAVKCLKNCFWSTLQTLHKHLKWCKPQKREKDHFCEKQVSDYCVCLCFGLQESCRVLQTDPSAAGMTECVCELNKSATAWTTAAIIQTKMTVVSWKFKFILFFSFSKPISLSFFSSGCGEKTKAMRESRIRLCQSPLHPCRAAVRPFRRLRRRRIGWARLQGM